MLRIDLMLTHYAQYQELFAICQALPGPGSTKMIFCLALLHAGFVPAIFVFLLWSLPGAIGMYALSLGVQRIHEILPLPVYALLSGLNAATVGIIALAAVQLAEKAIRDRLTRIQVIVGACAGLCYNALWYFPLLMALGGIASVIWDGWMAQMVGKMKKKWQQRGRGTESKSQQGESITLDERGEFQNAGAVQRRTLVTQPVKSSASVHREPSVAAERERPPLQHQEMVTDPKSPHAIRVSAGILLACGFFASFIAILVSRGVLRAPPLALDLFANMYLAGTVIFGGGPVVIPLLRTYVVAPGWVSSRDFLLGLALIQAFPGPNFNFGVYLGALALQQSRFPTVFGAFLGYVGIFTPGITLAVSVQSVWRVLRTKKWVIDLLRGINATAVGLVFTAVYRLWEIGYLTADA
ncbi:hypothetical protein LTS18_013235, partial [Coniosporium uncinatum]